MEETTDVIIVGCGPTGAMLSAQLAQLGVKNICIEKEADIVTDPRAIALDEDGIRALQSVGIYDDIYKDIGPCMGLFQFISGSHKDLKRRPFLSIDATTSDGGTGHVGYISHKQPHLEKYLRKSMLSSPLCELRQGCTLTAISEDEKCVCATYTSPDGSEKVLRGKFLVGADGRTGFIRKKYLEDKGILLLQASSTSYEETWVAVNWHISIPTPESHPHFPLWKAGYSPEQVYDLFFPQNFRFLCNPQRPAVCGSFGIPAERLWRFEFFVRPGEDGNELVGPENLNKILMPYLTHSGSSYGIQGNVTYPIDCIETLRAKPFLFSAKSCNKWSLGRVILSGDSAHVFPPFGGQGLASGFRDACSLAWRLRLACQENFKAYDRLLEAWYQERKQQLERSLALTVKNGRHVTESSPPKTFLRDTYLWVVQLVPSWRRQLEMGPRAAGMCRYRYDHGLHFIPQLDGGLLMPQVYCSPLCTMGPASTETAVCFTDDEIFHPEKRGLFQLVAFANSTADLPLVYGETWQAQQKNSNHPYLNMSEATVLVMDPRADLYGVKGTIYRTVRIATGQEFSVSPLCENRPPPKYYDEYRIQKELPSRRFVIVRPDRFVFAACTTSMELQSAVDQMDGILHSY